MRFEFPTVPGLLIIPQQAVLFRTQGPQVAVIGPGDKVRLRNVTMGRNLGNDVEIGSNCTIDRATFEATRIGEGTKIDNLVMIGHNNQIGRHNLLCGQVGIGIAWPMRSIISSFAPGTEAAVSLPPAGCTSGSTVP